MKAKKSVNTQLRVPGYVADVERELRISIQSGIEYPYVVPDDYVMLTCHDDNGDEFYIICHKDMEVQR